MGSVWQNGQGLGLRIIFQKIVNRSKSVYRPIKIERMNDKNPLSA